MIFDWAEDPVAALGTRLSRIARQEARIHAFVAIDEAGARHDAQLAAIRRAQLRPLSPIDGMPIAIKANIAVAGWPFHAGIDAYGTRVAARDAACVARLRAGGAVLLGLLNMDEGALGDTTDNPHFGRTENPWRAGFTAGGSSGGAGAAVAAGFCDAALGTDTLGSVRIPAAFCGVIGHKPRPGQISMEGVVPLAPPLDTVGILARSVAVAARVRDWLGMENAAPLASDFGTIGIFPGDGGAGFADVVEQARGLGCTVQAIGPFDHSLQAIAKAALLIVALEAHAVHADARARNPGGFSDGFSNILDWGQRQPMERQQAARTLLAQATEAIERAFAPFDAVLMPTTPHAAFAFGESRPSGTAYFTTLANIAGLAATAFPCGEDAKGMPLSVQAVGRDERACLGLAARLCRREDVLF